VRRLVQYRTKVLDVLRAPLADEELANMNFLLTVLNQQFTCSLEAGYDDPHYIFRAFLARPRPDALECVIGTCIDESVKSFHRDGMALDCLDVIVNGRADYFGWVPSLDGYDEWDEKCWLEFGLDVVLWG
jgi:hypothetical protein